MIWVRRGASTDGEQWDFLFLMLLVELEERPDATSKPESEWTDPRDLWAAIDLAHTRAQELLGAGWMVRAVEQGLCDQESPASDTYRIVRRGRSTRRSVHHARSAPELLLQMAIRSTAAAAEHDPRWRCVTLDELHVPLQAVARGALDVAVEGWEHDAEQRGFVEFAHRSPLFRLTAHGRRIAR